jgi:hypothetical protein
MGVQFLDATLAYFATLITHHVRTADTQELIAGDFVPILFDILERTPRSKDILGLIHGMSMSDAELRKAGISRTEKGLVGRFPGIQ